MTKKTMFLLCIENVNAQSNECLCIIMILDNENNKNGVQIIYSIIYFGAFFLKLCIMFFFNCS